jgi:orotidine-5'-phosphate decarboxylase
MGKDCMSALVDKEKWPGKALVGLCYTSNPTAREMQNVTIAVDGGTRFMPYWEFIAKCTLTWAGELGVTEDAGLVMAAAYELPPKGSGGIRSEHLLRCREIVGDKLWFLIPGIGTQGGFIYQTVKFAYYGPGSITINSSSDIIFSEDPGKKARLLRDTINAAIPK